MADEKNRIDLAAGIGSIQKEADGLKKTLAGVKKGLLQSIKTLETGFNSLSASGRALNNTLSNLFGSAKRTLASFDELDRPESGHSDTPAGAGGTVSVAVEDVSVQVDAGLIVEQIQQTINSTSGPEVNVELALDVTSLTKKVNDWALTLEGPEIKVELSLDDSSVTEKVNNWTLSLEATFGDLLSLNFTPLIGGLLAAAGAAGGLGLLLGELPSLDFTPLVGGILSVLFAAGQLATLFTGGAGAFFGGLPSTDFSKLIESISELTGISIPPLILGIAAILIAITATFGDGAKLVENAKLTFQGFLDFLNGIFIGDFQLAMTGVGEIFDGLRGIVDNVLLAVENLFTSFFDWLDEKTGGQFHATIQLVKDLVGGVVEWFGERLQGLADSLQLILGGIVTFLTGVFSGDWNKAWEGLKSVFKGFVNGLIGLVESFVNFFVRGINAIIGAANKLSFKAPDWLGGGTFGINIPKVPELKLPRLAAGAVIPPNREFMAVLGDQRSGTNIETPENLLRQIFREEAGSAAVVSELREILSAVREGKVMMVDSRVLGRVAQDSLAAAARAGGLSSVPVR